MPLPTRGRVSGGFLGAVSEEKHEGFRPWFSPQRFSIPSDGSPGTSNGANEKGKDGRNENVISVLDDESHVAGCGRCAKERVKEAFREF
jgi:hypothetical protein